MAKQDIIVDPKYRAMARIQSIDIEIRFLELERAVNYLSLNSSPDGSVSREKLPTSTFYHQLRF